MSAQGEGRVALIGVVMGLTPQGWRVIEELHEQKLDEAVSPMTNTNPQQPVQDVLDAIISKNDDLARFWTNPCGWAPVEAAGLLSKSRLDWQVSLSRTLRLWLPPEADVNAPDADGRLILAWANLGSLVEGSLKWFLSVFYDDYKGDSAAIRDRVGAVRDPDSLTLEPIRVFFKKSIWTPERDYDDWIRHVQQRRNVIHAYESRDIGTVQELDADIRKYLDFLQDLDSSVPYPD